MKTEIPEPPRPASFFVLDGEVADLLLREVFAAEAAFPEDRPFRASDRAIAYRRKPFPLRLVQNPLVDYEGAMAEHAALIAEYERLKADWLESTEIERKQGRAGLLMAWQKCHSQWGVAHWYALDEFAAESRTVGASAFYIEGLHRAGKLTLYA